MPTLQWLNREGALGGADAAPYRLLVEEAGLSAGTADFGNMLVQGDNLEALKSLLPMFAGRVKCVFIDPPYNTGSAFEHYDDNLEHSQWLSLMYPRLELLRDLLAEDGSIWITIDDDEAHYLKVICDEVFGRKNFVANVVWQKKASPQANAIWLSDSHDHLIVYAKRKNIWRPNLLPRSDVAKARYKNPDNDERGVWTSGDCSVSLMSGQRGAQYARTGHSDNLYEIVTPSGRRVLPPNGNCWRFSEERFLELVKDNRIWFGEDGNNVPRYKRYLSEVQEGVVCQTVWLRPEVGDNWEAKREVKEFDKDNVFATPKPERMLERILILSTTPGDLVLDSFLGSGTTAAVAHKMGRRYIGIELGDHAVTHCVPRLKKVIEGEQGGISESVGWKGGGGFRFYRLGPAVFDADGALHPDIRFPTLAAHIWFSETKTPWMGSPKSPLLGVHNGTAYYLLFNGILGDRRPQGGNVLNDPVYRMLPPHDGPKVIYGEWSQWRTDRLLREQIEFRQIPYDVRVR